MSSYNKIYYHIVFCTKNRNKTLPLEHSDLLYQYMWGFTKTKNCKLFRINGMEEHLHLFVSLHPALSLADFMKDLKISSSLWLKNNTLFPLFSGWAKGYGAFTYCVRDADMIINYIKKQREHHRKTEFKDEYKSLLIENKVEFDDKYFLLDE